LASYAGAITLLAKARDRAKEEGEAIGIKKSLGRAIPIGNRQDFVAPGKILRPRCIENLGNDLITLALNNREEVAEYIFDRDSEDQLDEGFLDGPKVILAEHGEKFIFIQMERGTQEIDPPANQEIA
jgi:hypothetical protein